VESRLSIEVESSIVRRRRRIEGLRRSCRVEEKKGKKEVVVRGRNVPSILRNFHRSLSSMTANSTSPVTLQSLIHGHSPSLKNLAIDSLLNSAVELPVSDSSLSDSSIAADSPPLHAVIPVALLLSPAAILHNREEVDCVERRERRELDSDRSNGRKGGRSS